MKSGYLALTIAVLLLTLTPLLSPKAAYAHSFSSDETSEFLSVVHKVRVESRLAGDNFSDPDLAAYHAEIAARAADDRVIEEIAERNERISRDLPAALAELQNAISTSSGDADELVNTIDNLLGEAISVRLEREQLGNSTTQAVVLANAIDQVLRDYGTAVGSEMDLTDMSMMQGMSDSEGSMGSMSGMDGMSEGDQMSGESMDESVTIVDEGAYQSAQAFAQLSIDIFQNDLRPLGIASTEDGAEREAAVPRIEAALLDLKEAVDSKAAPEQVMRIVHLNTHPNILLAYNLQVIPEFPLPLLLIVPAIASIIAFTRFKPLR